MASPGDIAALTLSLPWLGWWGTAATLAVRAAMPAPARRPPAALRLDVVVPAHDEEAAIGDLLRSLDDQVGPSVLGNVLVVADHCTDTTADIARRHGVEVLERNDGAAGKPPALRDGVAMLAARPDRGDAVVLLDADCRCDPGFLRGVGAELAAGADVVQAAYEVDDDDPGAIRSSLRRGFSLRNVVRATGGRRFGLPCLLFGSGIGLRWDAVAALSFADPRIQGTADSRPVADDVLMTLELLRHGYAARFSPEAGLVAPAPVHHGDLGAQRLRWEAGQALMWRHAARTVPTLLRRRQWRALVALVDWMTPPLVPSVLGYVAMTGIVAGAVAADVATPMALVGPGLAGLALAVYLGVGVSVLEGPRAAVDLVLGAPRYLWWKTALYRRHGEARRTSAAGRVSA